MKFVRVSAHALFTAAGVIVCLASASAAEFPFANDFSTAGFTNASAQFTHDGVGGLVNYAASGGTVLSVASEQITGFSSADFRISTRFKLNNVAGTGNLGTIGFGAFGTAHPFPSPASGDNPFYLADWGITNATSGAWGQLRIIGQGHALDAGAVSGDSDGQGANGSSVVIGNSYELRLTGTHNNGVLSLSLALFDGAGVQLGTAATATDSVPLTGEFFGLRNRTAGTNHLFDIGYDSFSVASVSAENVPGDYNDDKKVDIDDFDVWTGQFGNTGGSFNADGDDDLDVDGDDFLTWQENFGRPSVSFAAVPETPSLLLAWFSVSVGAACRKTRSSRRSLMRRSRSVALPSGGHGTRTRNRFPGT